MYLKRNTENTRAVHITSSLGIYYELNTTKALNIKYKKVSSGKSSNVFPQASVMSLNIMNAKYFTKMSPLGGTFKSHSVVFLQYN